MKFKKYPDLRFPEFSSEWISLRFGDFIKERIEYPEGKLPLYSLTIEDGIVPKTARYERSFLVKSDSKSYKLVKPLDFAFNPMNLRFGALAMHKGKGDVLVSKYYNIFYLNNKGVPSFFECYLTTHKMVQFYEKMATGTLEEKRRVHFSDFINFKKPIPSKSEQKKIADFFFSLDQKIMQLSQKKKLLEYYKKGLMQKLFPPEDGQAPEIRFKDENGEDFPDWEENSMDKFLKLLVTNSFSRNDLTYESGEVRNIHYGDIHSGFKMGFKVNEENVPYIIEEKKLSKYDEEQYVKPGDLIVADASEDYVDIGKAIEVLETGDEKILSGLHTIHARDKKHLTVVGFKGYLFRSEAIRKQLKRVSQGATVLGISKGNFRKISLKLPCLAEQRKIVEFLQNIDKNIALVESKIEKFQTFKKGLLQQMFV